MKFDRYTFYVTDLYVPYLSSYRGRFWTLRNKKEYDKF